MFSALSIIRNVFYGLVIQTEDQVNNSSVFRSTKLYSATLNELKDNLFQESFFILERSPYTIESYILPPYGNAKSKSAEDAFNFFKQCTNYSRVCIWGNGQKMGIF